MSIEKGPVRYTNHLWRTQQRVSEGLLYFISTAIWKLTYHRDPDSNQPRVKYQCKVLMNVTNHPSYCTKGANDPIEEEFRKLLSFVIHDDDCLMWSKRIYTLSFPFVEILKQHPTRGSTHRALLQKRNSDFITPGYQARKRTRLAHVRIHKSSLVKNCNPLMFIYGPRLNVLMARNKLHLIDYLKTEAKGSSGKVYSTWRSFRFFWFTFRSTYAFPCMAFSCERMSLGETKLGFLYSVCPPNDPRKIRMGLRTKRGPISTRDVAWI